jgi:predicted permease
MTDKGDAAKAEELSRKRARALPVLAILFLVQQINYITGAGAGDRTVDHVHIAAWLVQSFVMLLAMTTGGGWIYSRRVRQLANDEATRAHRADSFQVGFVAAMAGAILLYVVDLFEPMTGRDAIHLLLTVGIAAALLRFGMLERRALRDA